MNNVIEAPFIDFNTFIGVLKNGQKVFNRKPKESNGRRLEHIHIKRNILTTALSLISPEDDEVLVEQEIEFPNPVGKTGIVPTEFGDVIFYAKRSGKTGYSRFIEDVEPGNTNRVTVILLRKQEKPYEWTLLAAFYGSKAEKEPFGENPSKESKEYWKKHAMVNTEYDYDAETVTYYEP